MKKFILAMSILAAMYAGTSSVAGAAGGKRDPACSINPNPVAANQTYVVAAAGLPVSTTLNLWVSDPSGKTTGIPLGTVASGAISYATSSTSAGIWTYRITGANSTKQYASCSVQVT